MPARKVITLHAPIAQRVAQGILDSITGPLDDWGFRWWLNVGDLHSDDPNVLPDIVLYADTPQIWVERGATEAELDEFDRLWEAGEKELARHIAEEGLPEHLR